MILSYYSELPPAGSLPSAPDFSPALLAHIGRRSGADFRRSMAAWLLLFAALRDFGFIGTLDPIFSQRGQPMLSGGPFISLSHSGGFAAAAVSDCPVGIDVEQLAPRPVSRLAARCLNSAEQARFPAASDLEDCFYRHWTAKEAYAKCAGTGLQGFPAEIELFPDNTVSTRHLPAVFRTLTDAQRRSYTLCLVGAADPPVQIISKPEIFLQKGSL